MAETRIPVEFKASMEAKVYRVAWDRKPRWIPESAWIWLAKRRFPGTVRCEDLGEIASSDKGTLTVEAAPSLPAKH